MIHALWRHQNLKWFLWISNVLLGWNSFKSWRGWLQLSLQAPTKSTGPIKEAWLNLSLVRSMRRKHLQKLKSETVVLIRSISNRGIFLELSEVLTSGPMAFHRPWPHQNSMDHDKLWPKLCQNLLTVVYSIWNREKEWIKLLFWPFNLQKLAHRHK